MFLRQIARRISLQAKMRIQTFLNKHTDSIFAFASSYSERVKVCCALAKESEERGDYKAAREALSKVWPDISVRPVLEGLDYRTAAEVLLRAGTVAGWIGGTQQSEKVAGAKEMAQSLLGGSIALFEILGERACVAEAKIELAYCHYRNGAFEHARKILSDVLNLLPEDESDLRAIALMRSASVERHASRPKNSLSLLTEAAPYVEASANLSIKGRFHNELAVTLRNIGTTEQVPENIDRAIEEYAVASSYFNQIGHIRYEAAVENNLGFLLVSLGRYEEAREHLEQAREIFVSLDDDVHIAQVDETRARLALSEGNYAEAATIISGAVEIFESTDQYALLGEALTTYGVILSRMNRQAEVRSVLERARVMSERAGDTEGAGRASLTLIEEQGEMLSEDDLRESWTRASQMLARSTHPDTLMRLCACEDRVTSIYAEHLRRREQIAHTEKLAALGEIAFGVAHNVNNALTGILGRAHMLQRAATPSEIRKGLETIIKAANDGTQTIKRIQDFARQRTSHDLIPVSITPLLEDVREFTRSRWDGRASEAQIVFNLRLPEKELIVMCDAAELREVFINMIYNAVHAMPKGGEITLAANEVFDRFTGEKVVRITLTDTGTGMSDEVRTRVFDPFFTTKGMAGTGMGLAVSYGIIKRHRGVIEVESQLGQGTTFRITLPVAPPQCELAKTKNARTNRRVTPSEPHKSAKILVVDDEECVRELLCDVLEREGYQVVAASDGREALELFSNDEFDGVFTDVRMPEMSGLELAREMRRKSPRMPMAMITGWGDPLAPEDQNQVDWILSKPFELERITEIAGEVARMRALR